MDQDKDDIICTRLGRTIQSVDCCVLDRDIANGARSKHFKRIGGRGSWHFPKGIRSFVSNNQSWGELDGTSQPIKFRNLNGPLIQIDPSDTPFSVMEINIQGPKAGRLHYGILNKMI
jgi:hypothetical protein